jgi:hypothetical protein
VGIAANVVEHLLGTSEGALGIDVPFGIAHRSQITGEGVLDT